MNTKSLAIVSVVAVSVAAVIAPGGPARAQSFLEGPIANWSGPYFGVEGGYGWGSSDHRALGFDSGSFAVDGGLVGGTAGYNWQSGPLVLGLEGDMSWTDMSGATTGSPFAPCGGAVPACRTRLDSLGTARARLGYSLGSFMPFVTGGLAVGDLHGSEGDVPANGAAGSGDTYRVGWTVGGGVEDQFTPHWSGKLEYLHVDLGNGPVFTDTMPSGATAAQHVDFRTDILRAGINYKFW
jgi:outer membrane immunogenic protein